MKPKIAKGLQVLSESTVIPISLVIVVAGGIFWLTSIWAQGVANASAMKELQADRAAERAEYLGTVKSINESLGEIKGQVSFIRGKLESGK